MALPCSATLRPPEPWTFHHSPYGLTSVDLTTPYETGTNAAFGPVDFTLDYSGTTIDDSTSGKNLSAASSGGGTITLRSSIVVLDDATAVPEPSEGVLIALAVLAALAMLAFYRSRRHASVL